MLFVHDPKAMHHIAVKDQDIFEEATWFTRCVPAVSPVEYHLICTWASTRSIVNAGSLCVLSAQGLLPRTVRYPPLRLPSSTCVGTD